MILGLVSFGLGGLILAGSSFLSPKLDNLEKLTSYECGFEPFEDSRGRFNVKFYLVSLLFIIFDLEVAFLFPLVGLTVSTSGFVTLTVFLTALTVGFGYEWYTGALNWS